MEYPSSCLSILWSYGVTSAIGLGSGLFFMIMKEAIETIATAITPTAIYAYLEAKPLISG